jgi:hypothetical protein
MVAAAVGIGSAVAGVAGSAISASGANSAADAQQAANSSQIAQQNYEFNTIQGLLKPFQQAGTAAIPGMQSAMTNYESGLGAYQDILGQLNNLTGANGNAAQQAAIAGLQSNPLYTNSMNLGQQAILANASATGGLRNGNTIANLGYLPGQILSNVMQQQIGNIGTSLNGQSNYLNALNTAVSQQGNLVGLGENAAAGTGNAALQTGNNITSLLGQNGAIQAGSITAGTNAISSGINSLSGALGTYLNSGGNSGGSGGYGFTMPGAANAPYYFNAAGLTSPTGIVVGG